MLHSHDDAGALHALDGRGGCEGTREEWVRAKTLALRVLGSARTTPRLQATHPCSSSSERDVDALAVLRALDGGISQHLWSEHGAQGERQKKEWMRCE